MEPLDAEQTQTLMQLHRRGIISTGDLMAKLEIDYDAEVERMRQEVIYATAAKPPGCICPVCGSEDVEIAWAAGSLSYCRNCPVHFYNGAGTNRATVQMSVASIGDGDDVADRHQPDDDTNIFKALMKAAQERSPEPCPDCKGTKVYVGLTKTEPCRLCAGTGMA